MMRHARELMLLTLVALCGCSGPAPGGATHVSTASLRLTPLQSPLTGPVTRRTVYVPVYSSIYTGVKQRTIELSATVSVRNVSARLPLVLDSVRYYDSAGKKVRDYVSSPAVLGPLATVEFVIQEHDTEGGPGANFLVDWSGAQGVDDPLIEAVMVGQVGTAGISFTSAGRTVTSAGQ